MATQRNTRKNFGNSAFTRLLGTSSAKSFAPKDANLQRWAVLNVWPSQEAALAAIQLPSLRRWQQISKTTARLVLTPLSVKGSWGGVNPFVATTPKPISEAPGDNAARAPKSWTGPTAALTRARITPRRWIEFWRSSPPVARELAGAPGLLVAMGIGEAPIGLQGTFSLWQTNRDLTAFVQKGAAHLTAIKSATHRAWYTEDLFARLGVLAANGQIGALDLNELHLPSTQ